MYLYQGRKPTKTLTSYPPHEKEARQLYWLVMAAFFGFDKKPMTEDQLSEASYFIKHNVIYILPEWLSTMSALKTTAYTDEVHESKPYAKPNGLFKAIMSAEKATLGWDMSKEHIVYSKKLIQKLPDLLMHAEPFQMFYKQFKAMGGQNLVLQLVSDYFSYLGVGPDKPSSISFKPDTSRFMKEAFE